LEHARLYEQAQREIAERAQAEERMKASLREKEVLLKEIHHRVKNNLQVVSSMLHLQTRSVRDDAALAMFRESRIRVNSMALVHEKLYQSEDLAQVDFADYVRSLANYLHLSHGATASHVTMDVSVQDVSLSIDSAIPCGLILNELISNSFKHAFPEGRGGHVRVDFSQDGGEHLVMTVKDDGVGLPKDIDWRNTESLGLQLVTALVEQLEGSIELLQNGGTEFQIRFMELGRGEGDS
jgi:two-component sensor histidine kinase